jgi:superfamily I DNA/RNA helicase
MQLGIPYHLVRGTALMKQTVAMDATAYMRLMVNTRDDPAFERVCNKPKRSLGNLSSHISSTFRSPRILACLQEFILVPPPPHPTRPSLP